MQYASRLHNRIWKSPIPYENFVGIGLKSGRVWTQDAGGNRCL